MGRALHLKLKSEEVQSVITGTVPALTFGWSDVADSAGSFLGTTLVVGAVVAVLALRFVPKFVRAIRSVIR